MARDQFTVLTFFILALAGVCEPRLAHAATDAIALAPQELDRRSIERRATEAVIWGIPAVNYDLMYQAAVRNKARFNQIVYWSRLPDWKNQTLTPNPDSIYLMPFINTKDVGPMVLEIPPADDGVINGSVMDCWQTAIEDVGPAGVDQGKGGKYLILPPDYKGKIPDGYIPMPSGNNSNYALLRSILRSGSETDIAKAVAYAKRIKLYPLSQAANPPSTVFVDVIDDIYDATIPYDLRFYESLDRMVQSEPWLTRDKAMIDQLRTLGIQKGKPFKPDAATRKALEQGVAEAHAWLDQHYEGVFIPPYYEGTHWALPAQPEFAQGISTNYADPDSYPVDLRGVAYSMAFFSAKHLGKGQFYLMTIKDAQGHAFDGNRTYQLTVPAHAPVTQYWSATVYNRVTHALIRNMKWVSRSSQSPDLQKNADGSVDIYFGPKAPSGKETNWIPTDTRGDFEVLFRFYGPNKALFDKTWKLPDVRETRSQ
jgi:hypothetical protein